MHGADEMRKRVEETAAFECLAVEQRAESEHLWLVLRAPSESMMRSIRSSVSSNSPLRP